MSRRRPALPFSILASGALAGVVLLAWVSVRAEPLADIPNPRTRNGTWVTDLPGALRPATVATLNTRIGDVEQATGIETAVVVIGSLDGLSIEEAAARLFELWGIGKKDRDNGLLFLWSTGDRRMRIEVGYGLEGVLPDGKVGAILDTYVVPRFKAGEFDEGVLAGIDALLSAARGDAVAVQPPGSESYDEDGGGIGLFLLGLAGAVPVGVGGWFGARRFRRLRPRRCPRCRTRMRRLTEAEDDVHLEKGQLAEERVGSVDYDVWLCPSCANHLTLRYPKWISSYAACPQCGNRTKSSTEHVTRAATTRSSGNARVVEKCAYCTYTHQYTKTLAQLTESSSSSGSGSGSGFGGGSSGGGGASRGY